MRSSVFIKMSNATKQNWGSYPPSPLDTLFAPFQAIVKNAEYTILVLSQNHLRIEYDWDDFYIVFYDLYSPCWFYELTLENWVEMPYISLPLRLEATEQLILNSTYVDSTPV